MASKVRKPSPKLAKVAALRAGGMTWDAVAKKLRLNSNTIQGWPRRYPMPWAKALGAARRDLVNELTAEALLQLRNLLRSKDEKIVRDAATRLLQYFSLWSRKPRTKANPPQVPQTEFQQQLVQAGTLTHDDLRRLDDRFDRLLADSQGPPTPVETEPRAA